MDSFDVKILNIVQRNNRLSTERIAKQVGLSPSAVQRRLRRLREDRIIEAEGAIVSPEAVGRKLTAIVTVTVKQEQPLTRVLEGFKKTALAAPEVMQCYHVAGEADFIVVVTAKDMHEYEAISRKLFMENPNVRYYKSSIVFERVKSGMTIPVTLEQP
jgi:Lrp/AsnC family leucine-responsive transcriptional regulator